MCQIFKSFPKVVYLLIVVRLFMIVATANNPPNFQ